MIPRSKWGAKPLTKWTQAVAPSYRTGVVIHHTVTGEGTTQETVERILRQIDDYHRSRNWGGIGYNIAVDHAGRIYEARGMNIMGVHTANANGRNYGVVYIGDTRKNFTPAAAKAIEQVIDMLQANSKKKLVVKGHRDWASTACPGPKLYDLVKAGKFERPYPLAAAPKPPAPKPPAPAPVRPAPAPTTQHVTVKSGDSYWAIAARNLGLRNTKANAARIATETQRIQTLNNNAALHPGQNVRVR
jgi:hypothetical protein